MSNDLPPISGMGSEPSDSPAARVEPIPYYNPSEFVHRPVILTAVAIVCIVFSGLSILYNPVSLLITYIQTSMAIPIPTPPTTAPAATSGGASSSVIASSGGSAAFSNGPTPVASRSRMSQDNRDLVVTVLNRINPLSPRRQRLLDQLLAEVGDDPFPFGEATFSDAKIAGAISSSGQAPGETPATFFVTPNGRIDITNDLAIYSPEKGDPVTVSASTAQNNQSSSPAFPAFGSTTMKFSSKAAKLVLISTGIDFLLAIYLMYVAIRSLWDHPKSRRMYLRYVVLKFPAIIFTVIASWIWTQEMYTALLSAMPSVPAAAMTSSVTLLQSVVSGVIYALLPAAILIVMCTKGVRRYYLARTREVGGQAA